MIFSENRVPLFEIMLYGTDTRASGAGVLSRKAAAINGLMRCCASASCTACTWAAVPTRRCPAKASGSTATLPFGVHAFDQLLHLLDHEPVAAHADHSWGWPGDDDRSTVGMTAIAGVDEAICADFQMGKSAALGAGRKWRARHHGTAHCDGARGCGFDLGHGDAALVSSRGRHPAVRNGFSLAARATAGSKEACPHRRPSRRSYAFH
jgi:predicted dehydrogenase